MTLTGPSGTRTLTAQAPGAYQGHLGDTSPGNFLDPGSYNVAVPGGSAVGGFSASLTVPSPLVWTNQASAATINRANGLTVSWTGGDPTGFVLVSGNSAVVQNNVTIAGANFTCLALVSDGSFAVPPSVLLAMPPQPGVVSIDAYTNVGTFSTSGVDFGLAFTDAYTQINTVYQ